MRIFDPNPVYVLICNAFRVFFRVYGTWMVRGYDEYVPKSGPAIIISNHTSYVDPPLMGGAIRRPVAYMARHDLFTGNKLLAWVCKKLESYPVKQGTVDREALRYTYDKIDAGWLIGMFPEGRRSEDGRLQEFQPGLAMIALKSRAPVIPCGFAGTHEMLPRHAKGLKRSHIEVHFGPPLQVADLYDSDDRRAAMEELTRRAHVEVSRLMFEAQEARAKWYADKNH